jgi:RNA polymerase sigma-70 factor (ECF subfamily)
VTLVRSTVPFEGPPEPPTYTDAELIARSSDAPESFAALFDRHAAALHRYLTRRLGGFSSSGSVTEDLVAQTFLIAFEQRSRYDPSRADARAWLFGIATNLLRRHHRDEARLLRALARASADPPPAQCHADRVASRVDAGALSRRLAALLAGVPARERDVLLLYAWADLDADEISRALDIPPGTVRSRLHRARKRLRPALDGIGSDASEESFDG